MEKLDLARKSAAVYAGKAIVMAKDTAKLKAWFEYVYLSHFMNSF